MHPCRDNYETVNNDDQPHIQEAEEAAWESIVETLGVVPDNRVRVLVCVEGPTDVAALKSLSSALHDEDATIPDLSDDARIAFVVLGGGTLSHWVNEHYLKGLGRPEVHIYDHDVERYGQMIEQVNQRDDGSWGIQTSKLEIENYLHPDAITEGIGVTITFGDDDDVPALIAGEKGWRANTAKKKIAQYAFPNMTAERIREIDPHGEIEGWLRRIGGML